MTRAPSRMAHKAWQAAKILLKDSSALTRVCGTQSALTWLFHVVRTLPVSWHTGQLHAADDAMGSGPFEVRLRDARARLSAPSVFGGIREIWARDVYLQGGFLAIAPDAMVLDLGANVGNFTNLALAHGSGVRVVAVEPNKALNARFDSSVGLNGWRSRVCLVRAFLGVDEVPPQLAGRTEYGDAPCLTGAALLRDCAITKIDFLKCDIEGGEFRLLMEDDALLSITKQIAVEVHDHAGDRFRMIEHLRKRGFATLVRHSPADCIVLGKR